MKNSAQCNESLTQRGRSTKPKEGAARNAERVPSERGEGQRGMWRDCDTLCIDVRCKPMVSQCADSTFQPMRLRTVPGQAQGLFLVPHQQEKVQGGTSCNPCT